MIVKLHEATADSTAVADAVAFCIGRDTPVYRAAQEAASAIPDAEGRFILHLENVEDRQRDAFTERLRVTGERPLTGQAGAMVTLHRPMP